MVTQGKLVAAEHAMESVCEMSVSLLVAAGLIAQRVTEGSLPAGCTRDQNQIPAVHMCSNLKLGSAACLHTVGQLQW